MGNIGILMKKGEQDIANPKVKSIILVTQFYLFILRKQEWLFPYSGVEAEVQNFSCISAWENSRDLKLVLLDHRYVPSQV